MKRMVALKVIQAKSLQQPDAARRFLREVEAAARLNHPHIVTAYDAGEQDGKLFLVMELVSGCDLATLLKQQGPLPVATALDFVIQAGRGLAFAHDKRVIHRDIKPNNLLLSDDGVVKILDMGLARIDEDAAPGEFELTNSGRVMGTVDYMAPEQAIDTKTADARSDLYSLGCTLYRLLTNKPLYDGPTVVARIFAHANQPVPSLYASRPDVPAGVEQVFQRMVAKRPEDRYQTLHECVAALESVSRGAAAIPIARPVLNDIGDTTLVLHPMPIAPSTGHSTPSVRVARRRSKKRPPILLGVVAGGAAAVMLIVATVIIIRFSDGTVVVKADDHESVEIDGIKVNPQAHRRSSR